MANLRVNKIAAVGVSTENTGSVFFDGTDDRLDIASSTDFRIADSNTFECWINYNSLPGNNLFLGVESSYWVGYNHTGVGGASNKFVFTIYNGSSWQAVSSSTTPVVGTWYHLAAIKDGTSLKMFINGALENTTTMSGTAAVVNDFFNIGKWNQASAGQGVNGYLSNVRVCKGHAVYKSQFIPPTRELEVHPETVLLACYDGENIFADKSGRHIIAAYGDRLSSPTPTATDSPIGITTNNPGLTRSVDPTAGPTFQGGAGFVSQNWLTLPKGTTTDRNRTGGRGLFFGGYASPDYRTEMDYIQISSQGNAIKFGTLGSKNYSEGAPCGDSTRAINGGGAGLNNNMEYVVFATTSNPVDFGDLTVARRSLTAISNNTRGCWAGGTTNPAMSDVIDYATIASLGNTQDFGNLTVARRNQTPNGSTTRGTFAGGNPGSSPNLDDTIDYITFASTGNAVDFGNLATAMREQGGASSGIRGLIAGGYSAPAFRNEIEYITISTLGNGQDFGDLSLARSSTAGVSNKINGLFGGGSSPTLQNLIDYVTIASTGNAADFGDLTYAAVIYAGSQASDSHGGLS